MDQILENLDDFASKYVCTLMYKCADILPQT